jgi:hypothetical protein
MLAHATASLEHPLFRGAKLLKRLSRCDTFKLIQIDSIREKVARKHRYDPSPQSCDVRRATCDGVVQKSQDCRESVYVLSICSTQIKQKGKRKQQQQ